MIDAFVTWLTNWASTFVVWSPSPDEVGKVIAACTSLMALVQALKRLVEWIEKNPLLAKLLPKELREAIGALAHGWGTRVLAGIVTLVTMVPAVLDGGVTLAEVVNVVLAFAGALGMYELLRGRVGLLFPKRDGSSLGLVEALKRLFAKKPDATA